MNGSTMNGKVFSSESGIINVVPVGVTDQGEAIAVNFMLHELSRRAREDGRPVQILTDISQVSGSRPEGRLEIFRIVKELDYDKIAAFGAKPLIKSIADFILISSGMNAKARYFDTKKQALEWLES